MKNKVLIIEDEPGIAESLKYILETEGFNTLWVETLAEARALLFEGQHQLGGPQGVQLIIQDIGLPDGTGIEFCKEIRLQSSVPLLFLTARQEELDKIIALEVGGDDYVTKPFSGREVAARVKAILRRSQSDSIPVKSPSLESGSQAGDESSPLHINELTQQVEAMGQPLDLSRNEFYLFKLLFENPGQVFSRTQIMEAVWEVPESSMERTVDSHIKSLRKKLNPWSCIQTQRGFGYKYELEISESST